jgi:hypothetical protein
LPASAHEVCEAALSFIGDRSNLRTNRFGEMREDRDIDAIGFC